MKHLIKKLLREGLLGEKSIDQVSINDFNKKDVISNWMSSNPESVTNNFKFDMQDDYSLSKEEMDEIMDMDSEDIKDLDKFKNWLDYEVEYSIDNVIYTIKRYIKNGVISIWRVMTVSDKWLSELPNSGNRLGEYWSYEEDSAEAHWGSSETNVVKLKTTVSEKYIDWQQTIAANIDPAIGEDEKEIRLFKNTPIKIEEVLIEDNNHRFTGELDISNIKNKIFKA